MATVLISGGTGLVGKHLTQHLLQKGYQVIVLTRSSKLHSTNPKLSYALWNTEEQTIQEEAISKADYIINLAGAGVADKRWTTARKTEIAESRVKAGQLLVKSLNDIPNQVKAVINASAIGWYGPDTTESRKHGFAEDAPAKRYFLGETCRLWEESINPAQDLGKRVVKLRIGIVFSNDGGALAEFSKPVKYGIVPILGKGDQVISWIHIDDLCRMFLYAIEKESITGAYNAVAPNPVTNKELMLALANKLRGKVFIPVHVPAFALKIAIGEMSIEVLKSATVSSEKIQQAGFHFIYPTLSAALDADTI